MTTLLETTRREWQESSDRVEAGAADRERYLRLLDQVEILTAELRRRVGQTFTLAQLELVTDELRRRVGETFTLEDLVGVYRDADRWSREVLDERGDADAHRHTALLGDAAFHVYSRGAVDYRP